MFKKYFLNNEIWIKLQKNRSMLFGIGNNIIDRLGDLIYVDFNDDKLGYISGEIFCVIEGRIDFIEIYANNTLEVQKLNYKILNSLNLIDNNTWLFQININNTYIDKNLKKEFYFL